VPLLHMAVDVALVNKGNFILTAILAFHNQIPPAVYNIFLTYFKGFHRPGAKPAKSEPAS
jgi:hypothetical protein